MIASSSINPITFKKLIGATITTPVNTSFTAGAGYLVAGTYFYRVSAVTPSGETLASSETSLVLSVTGGVNVNWGAVTGATGYKIYGRATGAELYIATVGTVTTYLDNGTITPAGSLPATNTTGTNDNFPTMWNTLHATRKHGNSKIIPYYQKFKKDQVVYLQFTTDLDIPVTLKSFNGNTQIESTTSSTFDSSHGDTDTRYFYNFTVTLGSSYYDKKVWFTLTQVETVLTSEPIEILDLTEKIAKGIIKYVKYTNFDRNNSDLDERFIDWAILPGTGHYLDFFIEANDQEQNNKDEVEVLQGSQSQTILSASYFAGRVLKTGGIPDYLAAKLAIVSSLDLFLINGIQFIKQGGIESDRFGGSTLYQMSIKMIEKMTIGINVDNIGMAGTVIVPIAPPDPATVVYPMYIGSSYYIPDEATFKLMTEISDYKSNQTKNYSIIDERPSFAYPASYGTLVSILDHTGFEIISGFITLTRNFTQGSELVSYRVYYFKRRSTLTSFNITFKFT